MASLTEPLVGVNVRQYGNDNIPVEKYEKLFVNPQEGLVNKAFRLFQRNIQIQDENALKIIHGAFSHKYFNVVESDLIKLLGIIKPEALRELLNLFLETFLTLMRKEPEIPNEIATYREVINKCLSMVKEDTLRKAVNDLLTDEQIENAIATLEENGKKLSERNQKEAFISKINKKPYSPGVLETFLTAYSFFSTERTLNYSWEAMQLLEVHMGLVFIPFIFSAAMDDLLHLEAPFNRLNFFWWTALALLAGIIFINIYKKCRPIPGDASPFRNYTNEAQEGRYAPLMCREDVIRKIYTCWEASNDGTHPIPLLIGESGVGKTSIFTEVARRGVTSEIPESCQRMKGKTMFGGSAADLLPTSSSPMPTNDTMDRFFKRLEPHKNDVVVSIDEVHTFWLEEHASSYGEIVKGIFDTSARGFPFILAATTPANYRKYIAIDIQRSRRFQVIRVDPTTEIQTTLILRDMVQRFYPNVTVSDAVISQAFHLTTLHPTLKKYKQPDISKRMLSGAISSVKIKHSINPFDALILEKQQERDFLLEKYTAEVNSEEAEKIYQAIVEKKNEIELLEIQAKAFNVIKKKYEKFKKQFNETQTLLLSLAQRILDLRSNNQLLATQFKREFIFLKYFQLVALKKEIEKLALEINLTSVERELQSFINDFESPDEKPVKEETTSPSNKSTQIQTLKLPYVSEVGHVFKVQEEYYVVCHTMGDGACALHAALGKKLKNGMYFLERARFVFVTTLQEKLKEQKFATRLNEILAVYLDEFFHTKGRKLVDSQLHYLTMFFKIVPTDLLEEYKKQLSQLEQQKSVLKAEERNLIQEMMEEAVAKNKIEDLAKLLDCPKAIFNKKSQITPQDTFHYSEACFSKFKETSKQEALFGFFDQIGNRFKQNQTSLTTINKQIDDFSLKFVQENPKGFHEAYCRTCMNEMYYLSDLDITLIELLFNKRIAIYAAVNGDQISHTSGEGEQIVLYHRGKHYSRCEKTVKKEGRKVDNLDKKS